MSTKTRAARLLDELFTKPTDEFRPPMGKPVIKPVADKLGALIERTKNRPGRGETDHEWLLKEKARKEKAAEAVKAFRSRRKEQLAKARQSSAMSIAELRALAEKKRQDKKTLNRLVNNPNSGMSQGDHMPDADHEEKALSRPTTGWRSNSTNSEASNFDLIINHVGDWDKNQPGQHTTAEGQGADSSESRKDAAEHDLVDSGLGQKFVAVFDDSANERQRVFIDFFHEYYVSVLVPCRVCPKCDEIAQSAQDSEQDETDVLCKPCQSFIPDFEHPEEHMRRVHDGLVDVIQKKILKLDRDLRREAKKRGPLPGRAKPTAEEAAREGYTQTGNMIQVPGAVWVREYTNKPKKPK